MAALQVFKPRRAACSWGWVGWKIVVAEERPRTIAGTGVDVVVRARRETSPRHRLEPTP